MTILRGITTYLAVPDDTNLFTIKYYTLPFSQIIYEEVRKTVFNASKNYHLKTVKRIIKIYIYIEF